jgi:uncharacterized low-complexity protein
MSDKYMIKPVSAVVGAAFVSAVAVPSSAAAADNPFAIAELDEGYMLASHHKSEEGKCGGEKKAEEGKCGGEKKAEEGKCGEGKCGGEKKAEEGKCGGEKKAKEGSCGGHN